MDPADLPAEGTVVRHERTFTREEVEQFAALSGDHGAHHEAPDEDGRLVVHGLLTATLPTKVGGDLDVLARTMELEFHRPVYTGERVVCEVQIESVDRGDDRAALGAGVTCRNDDDEVVLTGAFDGVVLA